MQEFIDDIKNNPMLLGLGSVLLVIFIVLIHKYMVGKGAGNAILDSTNTAPPVAVPTNFVDAQGNPVYPQPVQNITNTYPVIQQGIPGQTGPAGATGDKGSPGIPGPIGPIGGIPVQPPYQHKSPSPKGTHGMSDNYWLYTTQATDTLQHVNDVIGKWGKQGPAFLTGYRDNAVVLQSWGVDLSNYHKALPAGIVLSV